MHTRTTPKTHLVPVIKGVTDPAKGLIFRTYHVRPEQLAEVLKEATTVVDKVHVPKIHLYSKLSKAIDSNDITHLRSLFSNDSHVWSLLVDRHLKASSHSKHHKQKLMQSIYAHILSQDPVFESVIKEYSTTAPIKKKVIIEHKESEQKKETRVSEKMSDSVLLGNEHDELLMPVIMPELYKNSRSLATQKNIIPLDYGKVLTKTKKYVDVQEHSKTGNEVSSFINFVNPSPAKTLALHKTLTGKGDDSSGVAKNLILQPHIYKHNSDYWSDALSKNIVGHYTNSESSMSSEALLYSNLMLRNIDKKRFFAIHSSMSDKKVAHAVSNKNNINAVLSGNTFSTPEKSLFIASLSPEDVKKYKYDILDMALHMHSNNDVNGALSIIAAYALHLNSNETYRLVNTTAPYLFSPARIMYSALENGTKDPFSYLVAQLIASRSAKMHYVPYNETHIFENAPFIPVLGMRVAKEITDNKVEELRNFYTQHNYMRTSDVQVGIKSPDTLPSDNQLFIRMNPVMVLDKIEDNVIPTGYAASGFLKAKNIILQRNNKVLAYNPIGSIIFNT